MTNLEVEQFLTNSGKTTDIEFLEMGKEKNDLIESAKKRGILIEGSRDLGIIKTIYAFTNKPNANKAILPSKEFQKKLPQIVGKPMNVGHIRDLIVGFYIDYKYILKENKAIAYAVFFKSIYPDIWKKAKLFRSRKKLSSSFEIWSPEEKRKYFKNGTYELHQMEMAGGALIFEEHGVEPAFKDAKVLEIAKKDVANCVAEECLVCASKYKSEEILMADKDYFMEEVKKNIKKLNEERKAKEQPKKVEPKKEVKVEEKKVEPKVEDKKPEVKVEKKVEPKKVEPKPEEKKAEPQTSKIKCSNCSEEIDYNGVDVRIKCPKCFAILNKEGVMQYPPQIKDFKVLCPSCKSSNWLILSRNEKEAKLRCETCAKECKVDFVQTNINTKELLDKFSFVYTGTASCPQCHKRIAISGVSNLKNRTIKCPKCNIEFSFDINQEAYKKISKIEEIKIDKIEKSAKTEKGGKEMDCKLELSKFHRYVENFEDFEKSLPKDYVKINGYIEPDRPEADLIVSARLTTEQRNALPDSDFAVVVRVKNKRTGKMRKIRMFPIHDKTHVRNALARLGQPAPQATLKKLGVSIEVTRKKILRKARQLKMTQLLERYKNASKVKPKKVKKVEPKKAEKFDCSCVKCGHKVTSTEHCVNLKCPKCGGQMRRASRPGNGKPEEKKKAKKKVDKAETQKRDLILYALEDKIVKYASGIRKLASKIRSTNKELKTAKVEKEDKIKFYKENAKKIHGRRIELGDFAKDLSDEDIVNNDKYEKAQLEKQLSEAKTIETATENVGDKVTKVDGYAKIRKEINKNAFPKVKGQE